MGGYGGRFFCFRDDIESVELSFSLVVFGLFKGKNIKEWELIWIKPKANVCRNL